MSVDPFTLAAIGMGVSALSAGASFVAQSQAAGAQQDFNNTQAENVRRATNATYDDLERVRREEMENASAQKFDTQVQGLEASATSQATASAMGVSGLSISGLLSDLYGQEARLNDTVNINSDRVNTQIAREKEQVQTTGRSQINSLRPPTNPDIAGTVLGAAGNMFQIYNSTLRIKPEDID